MMPEGRTIMPTIPTLTTDRLLLRPFTERDIDRVTDLLQAPEISATMLHVPYPYSRDDAVKWIARHPEGAAAGTDLTWAICRREDHLLNGTISIHITASHRRGAIGYWLGTPYWNQGYMSEAARAVVEYGFAELDLHRIEPTRMPEDTGSGRVMEKAGLAYEGTLRGYYLKNGLFLDATIHAKVREDHAG